MCFEGECQAHTHFVVSPPVEGVERHAHALLCLLTLIPAHAVKLGEKTNEEERTCFSEIDSCHCTV
jgi:hypothetical protein